MPNTLSHDECAELLCRVRNLTDQITNLRRLPAPSTAKIVHLATIRRNRAAIQAQLPQLRLVA